MPELQAERRKPRDLHRATRECGHLDISRHRLHPDVLDSDLRERYGIEHTTIQIESESYREIGQVHGGAGG